MKVHKKLINKFSEEYVSSSNQCCPFFPGNAASIYYIYGFKYMNFFNMYSSNTC